MSEKINPQDPYGLPKKPDKNKLINTLDMSKPGDVQTGQDGPSHKVPSEHRNKFQKHGDLNADTSSILDQLLGYYKQHTDSGIQILSGTLTHAQQAMPYIWLAIPYGKGEYKYTMVINGRVYIATHTFSAKVFQNQKEKMAGMLQHMKPLEDDDNLFASLEKQMQSIGTGEQGIIPILRKQNAPRYYKLCHDHKPIKVDGQEVTLGDVIANQRTLYPQWAQTYNTQHENEQIPTELSKFLLTFCVSGDQIPHKLSTHAPYSIIQKWKEMNPKIKICTVTLVPNSALQALHTQCEYYDALQYENILTYEMIVQEEKMTLRDAVCNDETYAAYVEEYNKQKEVRRLPGSLLHFGYAFCKSAKPIQKQIRDHPAIVSAIIAQYLDINSTSITSGSSNRILITAQEVKKLIKAKKGVNKQKQDHKSESEIKSED